MPETDAYGHLLTLQSEAEQRATSRRRAATDLRKEAESYEREADVMTQHAAWYGEAAAALAPAKADEEEAEAS